MSKLIFTVEPIDEKNCNVRIEASKGINRKLAYKMTEALESNMFRMIDGAFPARGKKGGKNGKN